MAEQLSERVLGILCAVLVALSEIDHACLLGCPGCLLAYELDDVRSYHRCGIAVIVLNQIDAGPVKLAGLLTGAFHGDDEDAADKFHMYTVPTGDMSGKCT